MTYENLLAQKAAENNDLIIMTAENRASIRNLSQKLKKQFVDVGIAEMTLVGSAAGLALRNRKPIVHALAMFLTGRAYEFIRTDVAYPNLPVKLVGSFPGLFSTGNGPTHQAIEDVGLMSNIPNMNVFCPADLEDMIIGLPKIIDSNEPFYIRYNDYVSTIKHSESFEIGKAELIMDGQNVTIFTYGILLKEAVEAAKRMAKSGLSVRVVNLRTVKPIDENLVFESALKTQYIVTLEDHWISSGLYSIITQLFNKYRIYKPVLPIGLENNWFRPAGDLDEIIKYEGLDEKSIATKVYRFIENMSV